MGAVKRIVAGSKKAGGIRFEWFLDREAVRSRIDKKKLAVLGQVGAYARGTVRKSIRPQKSGKKARTVLVGNREFIVPVRGRVVEARTGKEPSAKDAKAAREAMAKRRRFEDRGKPPRRGPKDLLRTNVLFYLDPATESVAVGARVFSRQPDLIGVSDVPELLEFGGKERIRGETAEYVPHPFIFPALDTSKKKFRDLVDKIPF